METALVLVLAGVFGLILVELALRASGIGAFPLYARGCAAGYRMKPLQSGRFRNRNTWVYDRHGMRSQLDPESLGGLTVVIGDSVVDGGVHVDQGQTLASQLSELLHEPAYPVACQGWSLGNALAGWRSLPGWKQAGRLILVLNTGDFDSVGAASSEWSFPTRRPVLLTPWLVARKAYRSPRIGRLLGNNPPPCRNPAIRARILDEFGQAMREFQGKVILVRYPQRGEDPAAEPFYDQLLAVLGAERTRLVNLVDRSDWGPRCYLDHIHPGPEGLTVLAAAIAAEVC